MPANTKPTVFQVILSFLRDIHWQMMTQLPTNAACKHLRSTPHDNSEIHLETARKLPFNWVVYKHFHDSAPSEPARAGAGLTRDVITWRRFSVTHRTVSGSPSRTSSHLFKPHSNWGKVATPLGIRLWWTSLWRLSPFAEAHSSEPPLRGAPERSGSFHRQQTGEKNKRSYYLEGGKKTK